MAPTSPQVGLDDRLDDRLAYRPTEAARIIGVSRSRIYDLMAEGVLPYAQLDGVRLIRRQALDDLLVQLERVAADPGPEPHEAA
jgi:excisionase family DNA binding protein